LAGDHSTDETSSRGHRQPRSPFQKGVDTFRKKGSTGPSPSLYSDSQLRPGFSPRPAGRTGLSNDGSLSARLREKMGLPAGERSLDEDPWRRASQAISRLICLLEDLRRMTAPVILPLFVDDQAELLRGPQEISPGFSHSRSERPFPRGLTDEEVIEAVGRNGPLKTWLIPPAKEESCFRCRPSQSPQSGGDRIVRSM